MERTHKFGKSNYTDQITKSQNPTKMNKTLSIGLAGYSFMIEEHAYIKLQDYLLALRNSLEADEVEEVMNDIEIRMVEIFKDLLNKREVINNDDVERVIAQIGTPEVIGEQEDAYYSNNNQKENKKTANNPFAANATKQLFKDPENAKIAGVCAGLAHYVGMDVTWMRIIWVTLAIVGIFSAHISTFLLIIVYIILWAVLPTANTTTDFLKMHGKPVNFDTIKEESGKIVQFANESTQKVGQLYNDNKKTINSAGNGIANLFRIFFGGIFGLMAVGMLIGCFALFGFVGNSDFPLISKMNFYFENGNMDYLLMCIAVLGALVPAIIFAVISIKLLSPKTKLRNVGWVILALIVTLIGLGVYFGINMAQKDMFLKGYKEDTQEVAINSTSDTLWVDVKQIEIPRNFKGYDDDIYSDKKAVFEEDYPFVTVTRKDNISAPYLIIKKEGKGYNLPISLNVNVDVTDNKISLPNFVKYPYDDRFRNYNVEYELVVPSKTRVLPVKKHTVTLRGDDDDYNDDDYNDDDDYNTGNITINRNGITINGTNISKAKGDNDSININGKFYHEDAAQKIVDSIKKDLKNNTKNVNLQIQNDNGKITIKTNK